MADVENILNGVLAKIAKEQNYEDYKTDYEVINSGGANYTSQLFSITLSAPGKDDLKLFAKIAMLGEKLRSMTTMQVFVTEIVFYTEIVAKYRELEERFNFPEEDRLVLPKYYGGSPEYLKEVLVLEELTVKGYQPYDRFQCFDWEYASQCLSALARLHALSVAFERDAPEQFMNIIEKLTFKFPMDEMTGFMERGIANAISVTAEEHKERLEKFLQKDLIAESFETYYNPKRKVVLVHGDFRPSNVLHKVNENGKLEVIVIDYQVIRKSNPLSDLIYFFICGSDEEFRGKYRHRFFEHYFEEFTATLRKLDIDPDEVYTKEDYDEDVKTYFRFGLIFGVVSLPFVTVDVAAAPKVEDGIDLESFNVELSNIFCTRFNALVSDYVKWGFL